MLYEVGLTQGLLFLRKHTMLPSQFSIFRPQTSVHSPLFSAIWVSFIKSHKNLSFGSRCTFYIIVVSSITSMKYEMLWCFLHILDAGGISSSDSGCTSKERGGKVTRDVMDLSVCTREKLTHVRDCKTGTHSSCYSPFFLFNITKSCLRNFNFQI